ncbi:MAG: hypothetical protein IPK98_03065 [Chloracidobacterium sp.]|nr:hypothetical protein [Chloracidobacterium sp.]
MAIHPTLTNYFLAGAQDNGSHQFSNVGLSTSVEVMGGDGAYVAIDQNEPQFQFVSYIFNQYRRSTNSGATWTTTNLNTTSGQFINPFDYDNTSNIMYCADNAASYRRWTKPQTARQVLWSCFKHGGQCNSLWVCRRLQLIRYILVPTAARL